MTILVFVSKSVAVVWRSRFTEHSKSYADKNVFTFGIILRDDTMLPNNKNWLMHTETKLNHGSNAEIPASDHYLNEITYSFVLGRSRNLLNVFISDNNQLSCSKHLRQIRKAGGVQWPYTAEQRVWCLNQSLKDVTSVELSRFQPTGGLPLIILQSALCGVFCTSFKQYEKDITCC